jgi:TonB family protein
MARGRAAAIALVALCAPAVAEDAAPRLGTLVDPKPIERKSPSYPMSALQGWKEGWVLVSFCVDTQGAVQNPVIERSSGVPEFERASLRAISQWKYEPARLDGLPVEQCQASVRLSFSMSGMPMGARPVFVRKWREASALIAQAKLAEAKVILDDLTPQNNYEGGRIALARSRIAQNTGDEQEQLAQLRAAMRQPQALEKDLLVNVERQVFALEVRNREWAAAYASYQALAKREDVLTPNERATGEKLDAMIRGGSVLSTDAKLECRCHRSNGAPLWSAQLLRREFGFGESVGAIERFELRCKGHRFSAAFEVDKAWRVPEAWGACTVYVFGEEGATFELLEYPAAGAAAAAPAAAPASS